MRGVDAVVTVHTNPYTCGVARFNLELAARLDVPCVRLDVASQYRAPLVSIHPREVAFGIDTEFVWMAYDLLLHSWEDSVRCRSWVSDARHVYAGNPEIAAGVRTVRPDVTELWAPSLIDGNPTRGEIHVVTMGMAHKIHLAPFERLKTLLDAQPSSYTVCASTAVHENAPWDGIGQVAETMRGIFGDQARALGYLADDAMVRELRDATAVAVFYDPAVRQNNTTFWTALTHGRMVITNLDAQSPPELVHNHSVYDIHQLTAWPHDRNLDREMRFRARAILDRYSWDRLLAQITEPVACP